MFVVPFSEARDGVGRKAFLLARLRQQGLPVPPGFIITPAALEQFLHVTRTSSAEGVQQASFPEEVFQGIRSAYQQLSIDQDIIAAGGMVFDLIKAGRGEALVAVRSAGHSRLNVRGTRQLQDAIKECWARGGQEIIVQKMVPADRTGVLFPHPQRKDTLLAEATWGLAVLDGHSPDLYRIQDGKVDVIPGEKPWLLERDSLSDRTVRNTVFPERQKQPCLDREDLQIILNLSRRAEELLGPGHVLEFSLDRRRPFLLQAGRSEFPEVPARAPQGRLLAKGEVIVPGHAEGKAVIVRDQLDVEKLQQGDILITPVFRQEFLSPRAGGMVTQAGSIYRLGKILAVPAVRAPVDSLQDGQRVRVDARDGAVYAL